MSIRIILDNPPEFYTNQDVIRGQVLLGLGRSEHIGAIIVKLEGEARTALAIPADSQNAAMASRDRGSPGDTLHENHKILYKVGQVFPDERAPVAASPYILNAGQHRFPFEFKFPFNNACSNTEAMARIGGVVSAGGAFGVGFRVMNGTKQLLYQHVTKTLPPSFTGFPGQAEIRYYIKITVQRPGLFKENWRYEMGLKFLPIEPPRPPKTNQEAYARRPFTFHPKSPTPTPYEKKRSSFFGGGRSSGPSTPVNGTPGLQPPSPAPLAAAPPSIEMSARLPHPATLTCNKPVPLRLVTKKLAPAQAEVYLTALQIDLVGKTTVRCQSLVNTEVSRWVITARHGLSVLVSRPEDPVGTEFPVPDTFWNTIPLPNTVMPSFVTCNLRYVYNLAHPPTHTPTLYSPSQPRIPTRNQDRPILGQTLGTRRRQRLPPRRPKQAQRPLRPPPGTPPPPPVQCRPSLLGPRAPGRPRRSHAPRPRPNLASATTTITTTTTTTRTTTNSPTPPPGSTPTPTSGPTPTPTPASATLRSPLPAAATAGPRALRRCPAHVRRGHGRGDDGARDPQHRPPRLQRHDE